VTLIRSFIPGNTLLSFAAELPDTVPR